MKKQLIIMIIIAAALVTTAEAQLSAVRVSLLSQESNPVAAGDVVTVKLTVENIGDAVAKEVWVEPVSDYPFTVISGYDKRQVINAIPLFPISESSAIVTFKFRVDRETTDGSYELNFKHAIGQESGLTLDNFSISVGSTSLSQDITLDKTTLMPGAETPLTFTISNTGVAPLQNAVFTWNDPKGMILPIGSGSTRYIPYLAPGESMPLQYNVMASVNANPDLYTLNMTLQSDLTMAGQTTKATLSTNVGIFVGGETDFDVAFSESSQGQTSLSVANIGITPAYSVTVTVPPQEGLRVDGSSMAIVGNLDKGDYTIVSFQISQAGTNFSRGALGNRTGFGQASPRTLNVVVQYTDTAGNRRAIEKIVPVQFRQMSAAGTTGAPGQNGAQFGRQGAASASTSATYVPIAILIIIGIWAAYLFRNKFFGRGKLSA